MKVFKSVSSFYVCLYYFKPHDFPQNAAYCEVRENFSKTRKSTFSLCTPLQAGKYKRLFKSVNFHQNPCLIVLYFYYDRFELKFYLYKLKAVMKSMRNISYMGRWTHVWLKQLFIAVPNEHQRSPYLQFDIFPLLSPRHPLADWSRSSKMSNFPVTTRKWG